MANQDDAAASAKAFAAVLAQLQAAKMADAEASKVAAQTGSSLAQAKQAIAAAAREEASAIAQAQQAKAKADAEEAAASKLKREAAISYQKFVRDSANEQKKAQKEAADAAKKAAGEQKQAAQDWHDSGSLMVSPIEAAKKALGGLGPYGAAAAMALGLVTAAATATVGALLAMAHAAIEVSETREELLAAFTAIGGGEKAGKATYDMVQRLSETLPFATSKLADWAMTMQRAGLSGKGLESAVKAIAAAAALNPKGGAEAAEKTISRLAAGEAEAKKFVEAIQKGGGKAQMLLREMGLNLADIGTQAQRAKMTAAQMSEAIQKALIKKGKGPLDNMTGDLATLVMKAKEGLMSVFSKVNVEPLMGPLGKLLGMFSKGSPMMATLRAAVTSVFGTILTWAGKALGVVQSAFQTGFIWALKLRIGINPIWVAIRQLWAEMVKLGRELSSLLPKGQSLGVMALIAMTIKGAFMVVAMAIRIVIGVITVAVAQVRAFVAMVKSLMPGVSGAGKGAGGNLVSSFVSGVTAKFGAVIGAMRGMGQAAKSALFGALGIASPSRVALEAARNVTSTFSDKVDDGKADVQRSFTGLVKVPPPGKGAASGGGSGASGPLVAALERVATALEMSPGGREMLIEAFAEAMGENA